MAYTTIDNPVEYFNTVLYTGTGSSLNVTGLNFKPDLTWVKRRDTTGGNKWTDAVRGAGIVLVSNATDAEFSQTGISSFNSDGFTVGTDSGDFNANGGTYASWNWLGANTTASNTDGTITSTVSANTTSGFSIVSYTGTGANATIGHGLGVAPKMIITKSRGTTNNWGTYHHSLGNTKAVFLNLTNAEDTASTYWNNTSPTSSVFSVGSAAGTNPANTMIAYCFAEVKGYSKFGSYTGNGSTDGTFVYTGFTPAFVIIKQTSSAGEGWEMADNKRSTFNVISTFLRGNSDAAESTNTDRQFDFLSNGIKMRGSHGSTNGSGATYIYMAFAENPFVSSTGIPTTAR